MAGKNINQDRDNGLWGDLLTQKDNEKDLSKLDGFEIPQADTSEKPAAKSQWSTGRQCPRCAHKLKIRELNTDTGNLIVECKHCGLVVPHSQIESEDSDWMFRQIPEDLKMRYMQSREEYLNRRDKQGG
jgi:hypothetical protein